MTTYDSNPQSLEDFLSQSDKIEIRKSLFGKNYLYKPTMSVMKKYTLYIDPMDADRCVDAIKEDAFAFKSIRRVSSGNCRVQVMVSKDQQAALVQFSRYVPHTYEPRTNPVLFTGEQVAPILKFVE